MIYHKQVDKNKNEVLSMLRQTGATARPWKGIGDGLLGIMVGYLGKLKNEQKLYHDYWHALWGRGKTLLKNFRCY